VSKKIDTKDGELDLGKQESPLETAAVEDKGHLSLSPARDVKSVCTSETRAQRLAKRSEGEDRVCCPSVHSKTPSRQIVHNMGDAARGVSIDPPQALQQEQGFLEERAFLPSVQWKWQSPEVF